MILRFYHVLLVELKFIPNLVYLSHSFINLAFYHLLQRILKCLKILVYAFLNYGFYNL